MQDQGRVSRDEELLVTPLDAIRMDQAAFSVSSLDQADADDKAYSREQTPQARLEALELMRQVMYGYDPIHDRIERVLEVSGCPLVETPLPEESPGGPTSPSERSP